MRIPLRNSVLFALLLIAPSCSDFGSNPIWSTWPNYTYRHLQYGLPSLTSSLGPNTPDSNGIWGWSSDSTGSLWLQFLYVKEQSNLYHQLPGDQSIPIVHDGFLGHIYTTNVDKNDRWYLMVYFTDIGDSGYQFVLYLIGLKDTTGAQIGRPTADQIIASISFHPSSMSPYVAKGLRDAPNKRLYLTEVPGCGID